MGLKIKTTMAPSKVQVSNTTIPVSFEEKDTQLDVEVGNVVSMIKVDQEYSPESNNAQSGKAVAEALESINPELSDNVKYIEQTLTEVQRDQARSNIDAASEEHTHTFTPEGKNTKPNVVTEVTNVEAITGIDTTAASLNLAYDTSLKRVTINFTEGFVTTIKKPVVGATHSYLDNAPIFSGKEVTTKVDTEEPSEPPKVERIAPFHSQLLKARTSPRQNLVKKQQQIKEEPKKEKAQASKNSLSISFD